MEQSISKQDGICIVTLSGRFDSVAAPLFDTWLSEQDTQETTGYLLEMKEVPYITSAGLRSILKLYKQAEAKGARVILCTVVPAVQDLFKMAGFSSFLTLRDSRESALEEFAA